MVHLKIGEIFPILAWKNGLWTERKKKPLFFYRFFVENLKQLQNLFCTIRVTI